MRDGIKKKRTGLIVLLSLLGFIILILLINEASFLYWEKDSYVESDLSCLMDPDCAPIYKLNGNDKAILFVHGMPSSPATYIYYSDLAAEDGYDIITPLLPGFGTTNVDLHGQTFSGWYKYLSETYEMYRRLYDEFYVVGLSMGGSLTLKLAEDYSDTELAPTAVAITAGAAFLNSIANGVILNPTLYVSRTAGWFVKELSGHDADYYEQYPDGGNRWRGYTGTFVRQLHSFKMNLKKIKRNLDEITVPIFLAHDVNDQTVPFENMGYIAEHVSSTWVETNAIDLGDVPHTHHILYIHDSSRDMMYDKIMSFFDRVGETD